VATRRPTLTVGLANFGATFPPGEWRRFVDLGRAADDAGIDRIVVVDHVVMGPHTEKYAWG
jgi:alkanesulfonate monooxygenase SsuD/methylene tetrahydromethanopterin reductase-like flavin-dependent oxidoreductase (luciferase family)